MEFLLRHTHEFGTVDQLLLGQYSQQEGNLHLGQQQEGWLYLEQQQEGNLFAKAAGGPASSWAATGGGP